MSTQIIDLKPRWTRSKDGWIFGVCTGLARNFGVETWVVQAVLLISLLCFGVGIIPYLALAITLPREDHLEIDKQKILGVCYKVALKAGIEVGLLRFITIMFAFGSLGLISLLYLFLYFFMPEPN